MKDGYYRIKTWAEMEEEFGLDSDGDVVTIYCHFLRIMENEMPKDRIIKVIDDQWRIGYGSWLITKEMIKERISMKKKDLLKRIQELEQKVSELEAEKPVEEERKHLELSVRKDDSKGSSKSIDYNINGMWAYTTHFTTDREYDHPEKNYMLCLVDISGTWEDEKGNEIKGYLSYHPKGE